MNLLISFIIPVYNRPEEIKELLESFSKQNSSQNYEIVIVEDGSFGFFYTVKTMDLYDEYRKTGFMEDIDVWICLTMNGKEFEIFDSKGSVGETFYLCDYFLNTKKEEILDPTDGTTFSLKHAGEELYSFALVPFYLWNDEEEAFEVLTIQDVYTRRDGMWINDLNTVRAEELSEE